MKKEFLDSLWGRVACFSIVVVVLAVSGVKLVQDLRIPREIALPSIPYTQTGTFDYAVSLKPSTLYGSAPLPSVDEVQEETEEEDEDEEEEEARHVFFRSIIDEFDMTFTYDLDAAEPLASTSMEAEVVVYAKDPGVWEKDIERYLLTQRTLPLALRYVLDDDHIVNSVEDIEEDIDISAGDVEYRLEGRVHLVAETLDGEIVEDTYVHSIELTIEDREIELFEPLTSSANVSGAPVGWVHSSRFDYDVFLKSNELFDEPVLRSAGLPVAEEEEEEAALPAAPRPMQVLGPGHTYFPNLVDHIDAEYTYTLESPSRVNDLSHDVGITVTIGNQDVWQKTISVIPTTTESEDFTVKFPIDINYYTAVIDAIGEETGARGASHALAITANVHSTGVTNLGTLNKTFEHTLTGTLEKASLVFEAETLVQTEEAEIGGGTRPNAAAPPGGWRSPWLAGVAIGLAGLGFLYWREQKLRATHLGPVESEAAAVKKKYRDLVVDTVALPERKAEEKVVALESPADLAKIADDAIKPMLHHQSDGVHQYLVLDGSVRYEYTIGPGTPVSED